MIDPDPVLNFEVFWKTFFERYPFFDLRHVDWGRQYQIYRSRITRQSTDEELFDTLCCMIDPLNDGHVEVKARIDGVKRRFTAEKPTRFHTALGKDGVRQLFQTTSRTLVSNGFDVPAPTEAWVLHYGRSESIGYLRILELEGIGKKKLSTALNKLQQDFSSLRGFIIDIRDNPGGDDSTAIAIINRFADRQRVAFHRRTKLGCGANDWSPLKTWHLEPHGSPPFVGPIILLTCDAVFSGGEAFALALRELPNVTIIGDHTNGIFSYTLEKTLPNGWDYCLSYQQYLSADMVCFEGRGVPPDIELLNTKADIETGTDPLIVRALEVLSAVSS
ncbi:MAG: S41 family peptidase [Hyphomicrobium sp.]